VGYCAAPAPLIAAVLNVHQWVTYSVNGAVQVAYANVVHQDPGCAALADFYQRKRDRFRDLLGATRFRPLACEGTFFQLVDYSAITDERDTDFAMRLTREHGVAAIPITPFLHDETPGTVVRFCFAKRDATLDAAAARLRKV
jgi:methionine aminotransferase